MRLLAFDEPLQNSALLEFKRLNTAVSSLHRIDLSDLGESDLVTFGTLATRVSGRNLSRVGEVYVKLCSDEMRYIVDEKIEQTHTSWLTASFSKGSCLGANIFFLPS
jgi:hypothetical protein